MRVKRQKRHRRVVKFFTACYGFRQPFKILCDGTFVHHLLVNEITPADIALANILGGPVKLFTSRCVLAELEKLGSAYAETFDVASKLVTARCDHEKPKRADECILDIMGENNSEHFFVGCQDVELRRKLQEVPGVPLVFALRNALLLEQPSASQRQFAKRTEEERLHMTESEFKMLGKRTKKILSTHDEELDYLSEENEGSDDQTTRKNQVAKPHSVKKALGVKDRVQFKRKKAKGPNPLSCLKKKNRESVKFTSAKEDKSNGSSTRTRSRKRRSRKSKTSPETNA